jgi:Na+/H+-dicarboxylate symporter
MARVAQWLEPVGTLWVNAIRMTVIPLVVPLLVVGVASTGDARRIGGLGLRAFILFFAMLTVAAVIATLISPPLFAHLTFDPASTTALRASAHVELPPADQLSFRTWLISLVPINPVKAIAEGDLLPVVVFTLAFAFALTRIATETRQAVVRFFRGISDAMLIVVHWLIVVAPIGVFVLALGLGMRLGTSVIGALAYYIGVTIAVHVVLAAALYVMASAGGGIGIRRFARAVLPAQVVALSTRSSLASLPALVKGSRDELRLPADVTGFILPLATSVFKLAAPLYWPLGAMMVARLWGIDLPPLQLATIAIGAVVLNASTPGIPSGGLLIQAPLYAKVGLPVEGLGILIAIDTLPDMFRTAFNITADMSVAAVLSRGLRPQHEDDGPAL